MENASKALLIAGGILLMILVLSFATYFFRRMAEDSSEVYRNMEESEIAEFNQKFLIYNGRTNLNVHDVVTILNLAYDCNKKGDFPVIVNVLLNGNPVQDKANDESYIKNLILNNIERKNYRCTVEYGTNSKFVDNVKIE